MNRTLACSGSVQVAKLIVQTRLELDEASKPQDKEETEIIRLGFALQMWLS